MAIKQKLTPEAFLSAPQRSAAVPSPSGELAFLTVSTHTFGEGTKKEVMLMDIDSGVMWSVCEDKNVSDLAWLPGRSERQTDGVGVAGDEPEEIVWLKKAEEGVTELVVTAAAAADKDDGNGEDGKGSYVAARIPGQVQALKLKRLEDGSIACAVVGLVGEDGGLYNEETAPKPASSARVFDSVRVREWKTYRNRQKYAIFYTVLVANDHTGRWAFAHPLRNVLRDTDLEAPADIYQPGDPADGFDLGELGIAFTARSPSQAGDLTRHDCCSIYFAPIRWSPSSSLQVPSALDDDEDEGDSTPQVVLRQGDDGDQLPAYADTADAAITTTGAGMASYPRFSPDGAVLAFLFSTLKCPADVRLHMAHISSTSGSAARVDAAFDVFGGQGDALEGFEFAPDGQSVYATAQRCGRVVLCEIELKHNAPPRLLHDQGSVGAYFPLGRASEAGGKEALLVSGSSFVESSFYKVVECGSKGSEDVEAEGRFEARTVSTATKGGARFGLDYDKQIGEMWFEGGGDYCVQAWEIRPSDFDRGKKYPVVMMIHGGPASAWMDEWHARWNPAVWAEQGYVVVMPNPTGSTGFGLEHATRIYGQWGGYPYKDLVACMEHLKKIPYIDTGRAVAAGGSYGGYMINWINGQPLGKQFKATVCHDSVFNCMTVDLMSDESTGLADFAGPALPWKNPEELEKWNPAKPERLVRWKKYAAPCLVIHGDCDYRCPITEGFAAFKTLQGMGIESRLLTFPDEGHWVEKKENALEWHRRVFEWINRFSGVEEERGIREVGEGVEDLLVF